ncbi:MAG: hypothetical protein LLG37_10020 [Spirochaetia bacterium]|nr:hypothetical protein [Spirochaetia bacterium]
MKKTLAAVALFVLAISALMTAGCKPVDNTGAVTPTFTATALPPTATLTPFVLSDGATVSNNGFWYSYTNNGAGNSNGFVLNVSGATNLTFTTSASPDYGVWWGFIPNSLQGTDWTYKPFAGYTGGIRFQARDTGARTFMVKIATKEDGSSTVIDQWAMEFTAPTTWTLVNLPFSSFTNTSGTQTLDQARANGYGLFIGMTAASQSGPLELDDITVY